MIVLLASPIIGQQAVPPGRPATRGRVPALVTFVAPEYPGRAHVYGTQTVITVDVVVGRDGRVQDAVVLWPPPDPPPPRQAPYLVNLGSPAQFREPVLKAVRQWIFDPSSIATPTVTVPVSIRFEILPSSRQPSFFADATSQPAIVTPADFEVVYSFGVYGCRLDTRAAEFRMSGAARAPYSPAVVAVRLTALQRDAIYREMVRVGFFEYGSFPVNYSRAPEPSLPDARFETSTTGIEVLVQAAPAMPRFTQPSVRHTIEAWRGGTSKTVSWDDQYIGPALTPAVEGIRLVIDRLQQVLKEHDAVRLLGPPVTDMCRAPQ